MNLRRFRFGLTALAGVVCLGLLLSGPIDAASRGAPGGQPGIDRYIVTLRNLAPTGASRAARGAEALSPAAAAAARTAEAARVSRVDRTIQSLAARHAITPGTTYHYALQGFAASLSGVQLAALRADPQVLSITPVRPVQPADAETVPTGVRRVGADPVNNPAVTELSSVNVAVIDTGIRYVPGDTELNVASSGVDCAKDSRLGKTGHKAWADVDVNEGHGTHVAGTIAARNTDTGIVGVAPGVQLFSVRIFANHVGSVVGDTETVACGVDWVASTRVDGQQPVGSQPIDVANMSIQGPRVVTDGASCPSPAGSGDAEHAAICAATNLGVTFVVAAGNNARNAADTVPAAYDSVITVSALSDYDGLPGGHDTTTGCSDDPDDSFASYSNFGPAVDLIAPGSCITSLGLSAGTTHDMSGTSMAAPHVTGAAAIFIALLLHDGVAHDPSAINADVVRAGLRAAAGYDWATASDPDTTPDRLLDVAALQSAEGVKVWAFPAIVHSGVPTGGGTDVHSTIAVELQRLGRFQGAVAISVDPTAPGITVVAPSASLSGTDVSTSLDVTVGAGTADGDYPITVHADGAVDPAAVTLRVDRHSPTIDSFGAAFVGGVPLGDGQPVRLSWSGSDVGTGIVRYEIQRQVGSSSTWTRFSISPQTATSAVRLIARKTDYAFRVRAVDAAGNVGDWSVLQLRAGIRDSAKSSISYSTNGSWVTRHKSSAYGDSFRRSTTPGAFAALSFTGRGVAWVAPVGPGRGTAEVYLDGADQAHLVATVSLSNARERSQWLAWASGPLSPGPHTLVIKVVGGTIDVDAIVILT